MRILSVKHALPSSEVTNQALVERILAHPDFRVPSDERPAFRAALEQYFKRSGAVTRYHRARSERAFELGLVAAERALASAEVEAEEIDLLIYVGVGRGFLEPANANVFQAALRLSNATCFDILDACASWLRAVDVARHFLRVGTYRRVMILNCEFNFKEYIRWDFGSVEDLSFLWPGFSVGEAATATILEQGSDPDDYYAVFKNWGSQHQLCQIPLYNASEFAPDGDFRANPPLRFFARALELSRFATTQLEDFYRADERLSGAVHDVVFGHSTSVPDVRRVLKRLNIEPSTYVDIFPRYGNTVSASVPLAISLASQDGRLHRGQRVLLLVPSAGVSIGFCQFTY